MKKLLFLKIFATILLLYAFPLKASNLKQKIGYISYQSTNIGDDIQAIATKNLLQKKGIPIDRQFISEFKYPVVLPVVVSGWFMHVKNDIGRHTFHNRKPKKIWPPSPYIHPYFISIHITGGMRESLTPEGIAYFKQYAPIGARDYDTMNFLLKHGIPSYFSGCLTLTLDNPYDNQRNDVIYAVDIPKDYVDYIRSHTSSKVVEITHAVPSSIGKNNKERLKYAESLLNKYRKAKCVITARLHVAMPCLAFKTPVLFFGSPGGRFDGLANLTHHCQYSEFINGEVDFDLDNPPANPEDYLEIRDALIDRMSKWISEQGALPAHK